MPQVIIVSNRLPVSVRKTEGKLEFYPSVGGLATGLSSYAARKRSKWIGWPGIPSDDLTEEEKKTISKELRKQRCYPVFLTQRQLDDFYNGYSNSILWPLFHNLPVDFGHRERFWHAYGEVNKLFAGRVLELSSPGNLVWAHDYQLLLLPELLRLERPRDRIGFFLHIPFPAPESFRQLTGHKRLLQGMLGADLVGFHTAAYTDNFLQCCHEADIGIPAVRQVILPDRTVRVTDFPMGIDYDKFASAGSSRTVRKTAREYKRKYRHRKIILTVDRLDPTKGLAERLQAYQTLLEHNPKLHRKVVMIMLATPSRTDIVEYQKLRARVEKLVDTINARFGTSRWQPVDYHYESLPFEQVATLYQIADVAFIAPIRDGMNLVAKEYIASRRGRSGVLILSETAGAAEELTDAILVNPSRRSSLVNGLTKALTMPRHDLKQRMSRMQQHLSSHTVHTWVNNFMESLEQPDPGGWRRPVLPGTGRHTWTLNESKERQLLEDYHRAQHRLLLLDYDGTLVPIVSEPEQAAPQPGLVQLIQILAADPHNHLVMLSGRSRDDLRAWFGKLPVTLAAEHGAQVKPAGKANWRSMTANSGRWQAKVLPILETYAKKTSGVLVEIKTSSLTWHYRNASPYHAQKNLVILQRVLDPLLNRYGLQALSSDKALEIKPADINKGNIISRWLEPTTDFVLAIGDDRTDEDTFTALPPLAYTIKVGRGRTGARFRLKNPAEVQALLRKLTT